MEKSQVRYAHDMFTRLLLTTAVDGQGLVYHVHTSMKPFVGAGRKTLALTPCRATSKMYQYRTSNQNRDTGSRPSLVHSARYQNCQEKTRPGHPMSCSTKRQNSRACWYLLPGSTNLESNLSFCCACPPSLNTAQFIFFMPPCSRTLYHPLSCCCWYVHGWG